MEAKGKNLIRLTSVLFLLIGLISTILFLMPTLLTAVFTGNTTGELQLGGMVITGLFGIYLLWSIFVFVVGIVGLKNANKPQKAGTLLVLGTILIVVSVISSIWSLFVQGIDVQIILSVFAGIVLPVLFVYGAKQNQRS